MRIIALGGCGGMGRYAVRTALTYDFVDEVVVADLDGERAAEFAQACGCRATGVPLAVALSLLAKRQIDRRGVCAPKAP